MTDTHAYLLTHNKTGLLYFGITKQAIKTYSGSGDYWKSHLKVHGRDLTKEVLFTTTNQEELTEFCEFFSEEYDIVKSKLFANLENING